MLAATAVLENGWRPNMTEEEAKKLVRDAIAAGIVNDMGSGSNVDLAILKPNDYCEVTILLIQIKPIRQNVIIKARYCTKGVCIDDKLLILPDPTAIRYSPTIWPKEKRLHISQRNYSRIEHEHIRYRNNCDTHCRSYGCASVV